MLVRLFGRNFRSLRDDFELSMVAADLKREEDRKRGVIHVPIQGFEDPLGLLRSVAIYGPNASGKSTVLLAAHALAWLVTESSPRSKPDSVIPPYEPFLLDARSKEAPVELGCDVVQGEHIVRYKIAYTSRTVLSEQLSRLDSSGETRLIERNDQGDVEGELIKNSKVNRLYVKEMQPNVAVLSKLAQHGPRRGKESVRSDYQAIRNALLYRDYSSIAGKIPGQNQATSQ
uniref:AAA family ATPase n=1 Tax=Aquisphaera insulae TaxID=2712864 RepID=UPI0013EBFB79